MEYEIETVMKITTVFEFSPLGNQYKCCTLTTRTVGVKFITVRLNRAHCISDRIKHTTAFQKYTNLTTFSHFTRDFQFYGLTNAI